VTKRLRKHWPNTRIVWRGDGHYAHPIERLWGLMHRNVTHNKCYATCAQFADATLDFLCEQVPRNWTHFCDSVTENFRVISPKNFRVMT
jgi:hypothetical protein